MSNSNIDEAGGRLVLLAELDNATTCSNKVRPSYVKAFFKFKWLIASCFIISAFLGLLYSLTLPSLYESVTLLEPVPEATSSGSGLSSQLGGLVGLAGVSLGNSTLDKVKLSSRILKSRTFIAHFIKKNNLLPSLVSHTYWDIKTDKWEVDLSLRDEVEKYVANESEADVENVFYRIATERLIENIQLNEDGGFYLLQVSSQSPKFAKFLSELIITELNQYVREIDVKEALASVNYLEKRVADTQIAEMEDVLYDLIAQQIKTILLAEVREEYVFRVIDPPVIPKTRSSPNRKIIIIFFAVAGLLFGLAIVAGKEIHLVMSQGVE